MKYGQRNKSQEVNVMLKLEKRENYSHWKFSNKTELTDEHSYSNPQYKKYKEMKKPEKPNKRYKEPKRPNLQLNMTSVSNQAPEGLFDQVMIDFGPARKFFLYIQNPHWKITTTFQFYWMCGGQSEYNRSRNREIRNARDFDEYRQCSICSWDER